MNSTEMERKCTEIQRGLRAVRPGYERWQLDIRHDIFGEPYIHVAVRRGANACEDIFRAEHLAHKPQAVIDGLVRWAETSFGTGPLRERP